MRALGFDVKKDEVRRIMSEFDHEESGQIGFNDFLEISKKSFMLSFTSKSDCENVRKRSI